MTNDDEMVIHQFVTSYDGSQEEAIAFEPDQAKRDPRIGAFRSEVISYVATAPERASLQLIRDLYRAETQHSRVKWCIHSEVIELAQALLMRGGSQFLEDYLLGRVQGFDAISSASCVHLPRERLSELLQVCKDRLEATSDEQKRRLWATGVDFFEACLGK